MVAAEKAAEAQQAYEAGHSEGLDLAKDWPWEALDWFADQNFDPEELSKGEDFPEFSLAGRPDEVYNPSVLKEHLEDVALGQGKLFKLGVRQALRDVWEAVLRGEQAVDERSKRPEPSDEEN
jgi:hypothetical protein